MKCWGTENNILRIDDEMYEGIGVKFSDVGCVATGQ